MIPEKVVIIYSGSGGSGLQANILGQLIQRLCQEVDAGNFQLPLTGGAQQAGMSLSVDMKMSGDSLDIHAAGVGQLTPSMFPLHGMITAAGTSYQLEIKHP